MKNPKILVAIPCFNHGKFLKQSIESIQMQSYENLDICVINDGSRPEQRIDEIVRDLMAGDDRIRLITSPENKGKWYCLNQAIQTSEADFCTSHDSDDVSLPNRIGRQIACLIGTQTIHNLCGFYHCFSEDDVEKSIINHKDGENLSVMQPDEIQKLVMMGYTSPGINHYFTGNFETAGVSALFHKSVFSLGMRFNPPGLGLRVLHSEDSDFNFRMTAYFGKTSILAEQQYCYRRNTSTNSELT